MEALVAWHPTLKGAPQALETAPGGHVSAGTPPGKVRRARRVAQKRLSPSPSQQLRSCHLLLVVVIAGATLWVVRAARRRFSDRFVEADTGARDHEAHHRGPLSPIWSATW
ncbi:hypothetical protein HS125_07120 [bacterium]|nr:hypothetical protein [bacterium]